MKGKSWRIARPSALLTFLLLIALSLSAGPLAAQDGGSPVRPNCATDSSVFNPSWDPDAEATTTFTLQKDCQTTENNYLEVKQDKKFTIEGGGYTIYAAAKARYSTVGTVIGFEDGGERMLTLRNLTIEGGGTETGASRRDNTPDPAIVSTSASLVLEDVTIQNTRGGAIRVIVDPSDGTKRVGKTTLKNVKLIGNQVSGAGADTQGAAITIDHGELILQNLFTLKTNTGGVGAIALKGAASTLDIYDLGCLDVSGNANAAGTATDIHPALTGELATLWNGKPTVTNDSCDKTTASTTPRPTPTPAGGGGSGAGGSGGGMTMPSLDKDGRIGGMIGSGSAYFLINRGGVWVLLIFRVDSDSVGHWVMDVSQTEVDAVSGAGCVAASPDGRYAVRVWADGNVTVSDGPDMEKKVFHNTLRGGLTPVIISTDTTYSSTPPGVGCPGYIG